ncbi:hypothetical protein GCM10009665_71510 [Kitasatospora nipponensis]|uniref:HTH cro/C1-type domain-containing protein n=1 Tax=Kitasatospora nipponensis TaxID=258049 RepID=A0ABN1X1Y1_9ACTN
MNDTDPRSTRRRTHVQQPIQDVPRVLANITHTMQTTLRRIVAELSNADHDLQAQHLELALQLQTQLDALTSGLVGHERSQRTTWARIGAALGMSEDTARHRFRDDRVRRRLQQFTRPPSAGRETPPAPRLLVPDSPQAPQPPVSPPALLPTEARASRNKLASVLSQAVRASNLSQREIARKSECSPSYLSRILSGDRIPTWRWTESVARACGTDPALLRGLWESERLRQYGTPRTAARTSPPTRLCPPEAFHALVTALCTLHVRCGAPSARDIAAASRNQLAPDQVESLLSGRDLTNWEHLAVLIHVMGGDVDYVRPLWQDAEPTAPQPATPRPLAPMPTTRGVAAKLRQARAADTGAAHPQPKPSA